MSANLLTVSLNGRDVSFDACNEHASIITEAVDAVLELINEWGSEPEKAAKTPQPRQLPERRPSLYDCRMPGCEIKDLTLGGIAQHGWKTHPEECKPCPVAPCPRKPFMFKEHVVTQHGQGAYDRWLAEQGQDQIPEAV